MPAEILVIDDEINIRKTLRSMLEMEGYENKRVARTEIRTYIRYYNTRRRHSSLGYLTPEQFAHKVEVLHAHCADVGRDPAEITLSVQHHCGADLAESAAHIAGFVDAGAQHVILYFEDNSDPKRLGQAVDTVVSRVGLAS